MFQNMSRIDMLYEIYLTSLEKPAWLSLELAKKAQPGKQNQGQVFKSVMLVDLLESSVCTMQTRHKMILTYSAVQYLENKQQIHCNYLSYYLVMSME